MKLGEFLLKQAQVELDGCFDRAIINVKSDGPFKAKLEGASTLKGSVEASEIELGVNGSSHAALDGTCQSAKINVDAPAHSKPLVSQSRTPT